MLSKKGNVALIVIACVLTVIVIAFIVFMIYSGVSSTENNTNKNSSSTQNKVNNSNNSTSNTNSNVNTKNEVKNDSENKKEIEDEEKVVEEVKKIDDSKGTIFEKEVSNGSYNVKVPVINLTTKAATRINSEVETKYKEASSKGYYIVYSYFMYTGMVTLILDNVYSDKHVYEVYNVNMETGKQMKNEDLLTKLKVSKEDFTKRAKAAYQAKFEEVFKGEDKNSNSYKSALNNTVNSVENIENQIIYINLEGKFEAYAKICSPKDSKEVYYLVEF